MKKKLISGLVVITVIFIISGIFVLKNLNSITSSQEFKEHQETILFRYSTILYDIKSAQAELYRHQAGYSRDIDSLVEYVLQLEDLLSLTRAEYGDYLNKSECNNCHSARGKIDSLEKMIKRTAGDLAVYKEKISLILTADNLEFADRLEKEATIDGDKILEDVSSIQHAALKMNDRMEEVQTASILRSKYSISLAVVASLFLSTIIVIILIRSITGPVNLLVRGIEKVSAGDYGSKVDIRTGDEIGFLAKTFNVMTDNLAETTRQKDSLMIDLRELNENLEQRVREATDKLKAAHENILRNETLSIVGTFASGVAHELATPLSSIISYVQVVKKRLKGNGELREDCDLIERELHRCRTILQGMLSFARAPEKEKAQIDINAAIRELLTLIKYQTEYKSITVIEDFSPDLPGVMAVPGQMKQVFMNIMVNALQSMSGTGEMRVSTALDADGRHVVVAVTDTGTGIPESEMNRIFQPFYTSKEKGTGLGLAISYGIIKAHGGDIQVKSAVGKGTTFIVSLPASV